jgi:hypothetical protein
MVICLEKFLIQKEQLIPYNAIIREANEEAGGGY